MPSEAPISSSPSRDTGPTSSTEATPSGSVDFPRSLLALYSLPMISVNFALVLFIAYITKFSIDVLLIAPGAIGMVFGLGRIWDAVTDPLAGTWSDRTRLALGRRRPWIVGAAIPMSLFTLAVWSPPGILEGTALVVWMTFAIFGFNTATTLFLVPHQSLGAELTEDTATRTRIFARRQQAGTIGQVLALVFGMTLLETAADPRNTAFWIAVVTAALSLALIIPCGLRLPERGDYRSRGGRSGITSARDVWRNPHARVLYTMIFIEHMGSGASMVIAPFLLRYVLGMPEMIGTVFAFYTGSTFLSISLWLRLSRRFGKKPTWIAAMVLGTLGYAVLFTVGDGQIVKMCFVVICTGAASGAGTVIGSAIIADLVDYDELHTGERKEGAYFSLYAFLYKTSSGVIAMFTGFALQWVGFEPNATQTDATNLVIRSLNGLVPLFAMVVGIAIFSRFRLTEAMHAEVRAALDAGRRRG